MVVVFGLVLVVVVELCSFLVLEVLLFGKRGLGVFGVVGLGLLLLVVSCFLWGPIFLGEIMFRCFLVLVLLGFRKLFAGICLRCSMLKCSMFCCVGGLLLFLFARVGSLEVRFRFLVVCFGFVLALIFSHVL